MASNDLDYAAEKMEVESATAIIVPISIKVYGLGFGLDERNSL